MWLLAYGQVNRPFRSLEHSNLRWTNDNALPQVTLIGWTLLTTNGHL